MITEEEFLKEENKDEIFSLIGGFLDRLRLEDWSLRTGGQIRLNKKEDSLVILDSAKGRIIKEMIKDFKEYIK